ncbi:MAG: hypothetical protein DI527_07470 [Chelatococcus sp.]|nr:MAG: hypothetical protein DI527_07470 [Chelatococcus sp.]
MSRRKGEITNRQRHRTHPFQVEIVVPETGLGNAMLIMYRWASAHSHATVRSHAGMRWCFCRPETADAFATDFGGRRVDMPVDPASLHVDRPDARELARRAEAARLGIEIWTGGRES